MRQLHFFRFACLLTLLAVLSACTTEPAVKVERMQLQSVLLLPLRSMHDELLVGSEFVHERLVERLDDLDFQVELLSDVVFEELEEKALELSGSVYNPKIGQFVPLDKSVYQYQLIQLIAREYDFDALIFPQLWLRTTKVNVDEASWDGVSREIEFINKPERTYKLPKSARGVSLQLAAFSRNGGKISTGFGGIALPYKVNFVAGKSAFSLKTSFYEESEVKQAVDVALQSFNNQVEAP